MKVSIKALIFICVFSMLLAACEKGGDVGGLGSVAWEAMPEVTFGMLESEKLAVQEWNSGRAEETSRYAFCEGEKGYYFVNNFGYLYYADKSNVANWIVVCSKPDCDHQDFRSGCSAFLQTDRFIAKDGRLHYSGYIANHPHLFDSDKNGNAILSMAPDGSDLRQEYHIEEALLSDGGGFSDHLLSNCWVYFVNELDKDGASTTRLFRTSESGTKLLWEEFNGDGQNALFLISQSALSGMNGEELFYCNAFDDPGYFNFRQENPVKVELPDVPTLGAYLAGNTLRFFRQNDGYYDYNMETGEEVFLTAARLENSYTAIMLPNLIVESTLLYRQSVQGRLPQMEHRMEIFDGQQWHSIQLPEELRLAEKDFILAVRVVTSDAVWFSSNETVTEIVDGEVHEYHDQHLYRIQLDTDEWMLEHFATVQQPRVPKK